MKKFYIIIFLSVMIISCGKKNDPIYKEQSSKLFDTKSIVVS
tara:strand:- start:139 stop:264 length:126 start_codon:yes stop_codon:yes gene_type:complete